MSVPRMRPSRAATSSCGLLLQDLVVQVMHDGSLVATKPYSSPGYGLGQAITILGCQGPSYDALRQLEIEVKVAFMDPIRGPKIKQLLHGMVGINVVRSALNQIASS